MITKGINKAGLVHNLITRVGNFHKSFHKYPLFYTTGLLTNVCNNCKSRMVTAYRCDISNIDICFNCFFNITNQGDFAAISEVYGAAINGKIEVLVGHEDMNKVFANGMTPLFLAVIHGHKELVAYLLENGDALSLITTENRNAFHVAIEEGREDIMRLLYEHAKKNKIKILETEDKYGMTAIHIACEKGIQSIVSFLITEGAGVNTQDMLGETPLHFAAYNGHLTIVKELITHNADLTKENKFGYTPHNSSEILQHQQVIELFEANKAPKNSLENLREKLKKVHDHPCIFVRGKVHICNICVKSSFLYFGCEQCEFDICFNCFNDC